MSVRAISKLTEIILMGTRRGQLDFTVATSTLTEDKIARTLKATPDARDPCYNLRHELIIFVDQFHESDFHRKPTAQ